MLLRNAKLAAWRFRRLAIGPRRIEAGLARRFGACGRCGACCHLRSLWPMPQVGLLRCPALARSPEGLATCALHDHRPGLCRLFPVDETDLAARDLVSPGTRCGFGFYDVR